MVPTQTFYRSVQDTDGDVYGTEKFLGGCQADHPLCPSR
jgi:hypothetical protein